MFIWARLFNVHNVIIKQSNLLTHQKSVHMGQKFQCPECEYKATQKSNVLTHQKSKHMAKNHGNPEISK